MDKYTTDHPAFKEDPITQAIDKLNETLNRYSYKLDNFTIKETTPTRGKGLILVNGYIITEVTYKAIKKDSLKVL